MKKAFFHSWLNNDTFNYPILFFSKKAVSQIENKMMLLFKLNTYSYTELYVWLALSSYPSLHESCADLY